MPVRSDKQYWSNRICEYPAILAQVNLHLTLFKKLNSEFFIKIFTNNFRWLRSTAFIIVDEPHRVESTRSTIPKPRQIIMANSNFACKLEFLLGDYFVASGQAVQCFLNGTVYSEEFGGVVRTPLKNNQKIWRDTLLRIFRIGLDQHKSNWNGQAQTESPNRNLPYSKGKTSSSRASENVNSKNAAAIQNCKSQTSADNPLKKPQRQSSLRQQFCGPICDHFPRMVSLRVNDWKVEFKTLRLPPDTTQYRTSNDNVHEQIYTVEFMFNLQLRESRKQSV